MKAPNQTIARFRHNHADYELDHLGIAVPEGWGEFALFSDGEMTAEFRVEFPAATLTGEQFPPLPGIGVLEQLTHHALDVAAGAPDRMTLRLDNRDVVAAWCGGHLPDDPGSDVLLVDRAGRRAVIVPGQTVERTDNGFRILDRTGGA